MRNRYIRHCVAILVCVLCFTVAGKLKAYGATANISVSSQNVAKGSEVKVSINVTSEQNIGAFDLRITYNSKVLEYVSGADNGGSGVLQVLNSDLSQTNTITKELVFNAISEGVCEIAVQASSSSVMDISAAAMDIAGGTGSVTVGAGASADNNLSSLVISAVDEEGNTADVSLTPEFSSDVVEYRAEVAENISKLAVAVTTSDASATTKISGVKLDAGENLTTVDVTAADGQVKEYKIYTVKTASSTSDEGTTDALPVPEDRTPYFAEKTGKYIIQTFDSVGIPSGFSECGFAYGEKQVAALSGYNGKVLLLCLADDENGANAALFVYNSGTDVFSLYNNYLSEEKTYVMLTPDSDTVIPEGYTETTIKINDVDTIAWQREGYKSDSGFYLVYAISQSGNKGFYVYDAEEDTFMRYVSDMDDAVLTSDSQSEYDELKSKYDDEKIVRIEIIAGFMVLCAIMIIYIAVLLRKIKINETDPDAEPEENSVEKAGSEKDSACEPDAQPKELKLDMAMQANEVKTETLADSVNKILEEDMNKADTENRSDEGLENNTDTNEQNKEKESDTANKSAAEDSEMDIVFVDFESDDK